jgi:hypothetical protein
MIVLALGIGVRTYFAKYLFSDDSVRLNSIGIRFQQLTFFLVRLVPIQGVERVKALIALAELIERQLPTRALTYE